MTQASPEMAILIAAVLLLTTVMAGNLSSRFGLPALIGFLALGMLAGSDGLGGIVFDDYVLAQTIGVLCLIFILFSGGLDTDWRAVRGVAAPALVLATLGVLMSAGIIAAIAMLVLDFSWLQGFLLGAVVASTDAAAVFAIVRAQSKPLKPEIAGLIELESGSNDPGAIFLVGATLLLIGGAAPLGALAGDFAIQMLVGAGAGVLVGLLTPLALNRARLGVAGLAFVTSVAVALFAFGGAEVAYGNGFLAAYVAGIVAGNRDFTAKREVLLFQDGLAWLAQVVMFVSLGLLVFPSQLPSVVTPGLIITAALMFIARPISVFVCLAPFRRFDWRVKIFVAWAGLRGAVPIVLATFPIVAGAPSAQTIFNIVFFVVVASNLIQGPTLGPLAHRLGLTEADAIPPPPGQVERKSASEQSR
ncbi:MAG: potassium/proton antiporter [Hyphomonadaceae bacterium]